MKSVFSSPMLNKRSQPVIEPTDPGGPNYIGAVDYPSTVFNGYIGSSNYVYEPRAIGYNMIDNSKAILPIAKSPKDVDYRKLNLSSLAESVFSECNIPSFLQSSEYTIRRCNLKMAMFIFKSILLFNLILLLIWRTNVTMLTVGLFIIFHIALYYLLTVVYINVAIGEWKMILKYKYFIKKNIDYNLSDSLLKQFDDINEFTKKQSINRSQFLNTILGGSIFFAWFTLLGVNNK
jgi:hypothetical protein